MKFLKENFSLTKNNVITLLNEIATYADQLAEDARELTYSLDNGELNSIPKRDHAGIEDPEVFNSTDADDEEGYFKGVSTDKLRGILKILRKMKNGESLTKDGEKVFLSKNGSMNESISKSDRDIIIDAVKGEFETSHGYMEDKDEFEEMMGRRLTRSKYEELKDFYNELQDLGPRGFYEEYKDKLEFDPDFVEEYGYSEDDGYDDLELDEYKNESLKESYLENLKDPVYWQHQVDYQLEHFGRIGDGLIQDLDEAGFYLDADNKAVKKLHEDTVKDPKIRWIFIKSKEVEDSDGFLTDYTWYECSDGTQAMVFGDNDIYKPEDGYFDITFTDRKQAEDWFNSY